MAETTTGEMTDDAPETAETAETAPEPAPLTTVRNTRAPDPFYAYSSLTIALHWLAFAGLVALVALDGPLHASLGFVLALPLLWRAMRRFANGFPRVPDQPIVLNFIARLTMIALLLSIIMLALSGSALPLLEGRVYEVFGLAIGAAPWEGHPPSAVIVRELHGLAAMGFLGAVILHLVFAIKHVITRSDGILLRIVRPLAGGK